MPPILFPRLLMSKTCLGVVVSLSAFVLTACSAEADAPQPGAPATAAVKDTTGILETSTGSYVFTPSTCTTYKEDGVDDIEIRGPGTDPEGEKFYFELSSTANAITLKLGVDKPFASSERKLQAGQFVSRKFTIDVSGNIISASNLVLVDSQGQTVDAKASLRIDCGA